MREYGLTRTEAIDKLCLLSTQAIRKLAAKMYYDARKRGLESYRMGLVSDAMPHTGREQLAGSCSV